MEWRDWFIPRTLTRKKEAPFSLNQPHEEDLERLHELKAAGSKMDLPHPIRHFLHLPSEAAGRQAMEALKPSGYQVTLRAASEERWLVVAVIGQIPEAGRVTKMREIMTALAVTLGGDYAGWEAPLVY